MSNHLKCKVCLIFEIWLKKTKSEHTPENFKSWEMLVHDIEEDQIEKEFVNVLIKMFNQKAMSPLELFVKLVDNKRKFPNMINFILEHVDPVSQRWFRSLFL